MDGPRRPVQNRFVSAVFKNPAINSLLQAGAKEIHPGKPSRGGQFTAEQRTWARNLIERKFWKHVTAEDQNSLVSGTASPDLSYLLPHARSHIESQCTLPENTPVATEVPPVQRQAAAPTPPPTPPPTRKLRAATASAWCPRTLKNHVNGLVEQISAASSSTEDATLICDKLLRTLTEKFPGCIDDLPFLKPKDCHCEPLVKELSSMRQQWQNVNLPVVRALDKSLHDAGITAEKMAALGYVQSKSLAKKAVLRSSKNWTMKSKGGRPSKVKDVRWQGLVKDALDMFSTSSSWTCLGPDKERRRVRSLSANASTILRTGGTCMFACFFQVNVFFERKHVNP